MLRRSVRYREIGITRPGDGAIAERRPAEESRREESCQSLRSWTEDRGPKDLDAAD